MDNNKLYVKVKGDKVYFVKPKDKTEETKSDKADKIVKEIGERQFLLGDSALQDNRKEDTEAKIQSLEKKVNQLMKRNNENSELSEIMKALNGIENGGSGGLNKIADPEATPKFKK